ncbi:MAG: DUF305 domain-containing protein [Bacteriovorax sp.]|nr:DUF305 domain-containing protein [Bacteriovorax sp.]
MIKNLLLIGFILTSTPLLANRKVEAEYLEKMSLFHKDGIENSKIALSKTQNKEIVKIAKKIIVEQTKEKKQLEKLRAKLYSDIRSSGNINKYPESGELKKSMGLEFDKLYLDSMAKQNKYEIMLTSKMLPEIISDEVHHMAVKIVKNKGNEIEKLEKIKNTLE